MMLTTIPLSQDEALIRIADKVAVGDGCWEWTAYKNTGRVTGGYGLLKVNGRRYMAHRVLKEIVDGPPPVGTEADHLCRNRGCVRPSHIEWVTHAENVRRGGAAETQRRRLTGVPGYLAEKTHCVRGHPFDEMNTYRRQGRRHCRLCRRDWMRAKKKRTQ